MSRIGVEILDWRRSTDWSPESVGGKVGERSTDNSLDVVSMVWYYTDCSSVFDDGASICFDGGAVGCSLVGFKWCALDGQESGVVPFGVEIVG